MEEQIEDNQEILLNPATHENMDKPMDMDFGLGNLQSSGAGFEMGLDMGLDF